MDTFCLKSSSRTQKGDGVSGSVPLFLEPRILLSYSQTEKDAIHDGFHVVIFANSFVSGWLNIQSVIIRPTFVTLLQ